VKLVVSAAAPPHELFQASPPHASSSVEVGQDQNHGDLLGDATYLSKSHDEVFAFDRTISRLLEMQSVAYLAEASQAHSAGAFARSPGASFRAGADLVSELDFSALDDQTLGQLWDAYDVDGSGNVDDDELHALVADLAHAFDQAKRQDENNAASNTVQSSETTAGKQVAGVEKGVADWEKGGAAAAASGGRLVSEAVVSAHLEAMDADKDGVVTKKEFLEYARGAAFRGLC